jgi:hypothetical protein
LCSPACDYISPAISSDAFLGRSTDVKYTEQNRTS